MELQGTPDTNWTNIEFHHEKPINLFNVYNHGELKEALSRKNTQPLIKGIHLKKKLSLIS